MKKSFDCKKCSHNKVCKNIEIMLEIKEKVETEEYNINIKIPEDSFDITMNCKYYKPDISGTVRLNDIIAQKS